MPKHKIDLAGQMAECEANYARVMRLMPDMAEIDHREFAVSHLGDGASRISIKVLERCKYTTMLDVCQLQQAMVWSSAPHFRLRVYHDASMAEVTEFQQHRRLQPDYDYPNEQMYHSNEKAQLNSFLGEWLSHCLRYGYALGDSSSSIASCEP